MGDVSLAFVVAQDLEAVGPGLDIGPGGGRGGREGEGGLVSDWLPTLFPLPLSLPPSLPPSVPSLPHAQQVEHSSLELHGNGRGRVKSILARPLRRDLRPFCACGGSLESEAFGGDA